MKLGGIHAMLDGTEPVRGEIRSNHDALEVGEGIPHLTLSLSHHTSPASRVAFLRKLAEAASDLADEIDLRDLEGAA